MYFGSDPITDTYALLRMSRETLDLARGQKKSISDLLETTKETIRRSQHLIAQTDRIIDSWGGARGAHRRKVVVFAASN
jgi:hypothetical protein